MRNAIFICVFVVLILVIIGGLIYLYIDKKKSGNMPVINNQKDKAIRPRAKKQERLSVNDG